MRRLDQHVLTGNRFLADILGNCLNFANGGFEVIHRLTEPRDRPFKLVRTLL